MPVSTATRMLILSALLGSPLLPASLGGASTAHAQSAVFDEAAFFALPGPVAVGDGSTPTDLFVVALGTDGAPISGISGRIVASEGSADAIEEVEPGLYKLRWTPPRVTSPTAVDITLRARMADRSTASPSFSVQVAPRGSKGIRGTANPSQLVLGQDASATLTMQLSGGPEQVLDGTALEVSASVGSVSNLTHLGGGQFSALYTPPNRPYPHVAVITFADKRDPSTIYGTTAMQLVGKANFPVSASPNSRVMIRINDRDFGPVQADATGRTSVPIVVPPGFNTATLITIEGDNKTESPLDLQLPPTPRVEMFPTDATIPADPSISVPVRVAVVQVTGEPDTEASVSFSTTAGEVSDASHIGGGVYEATFTPPYGNATSQATITVNVDDPRGAQTDAITLNLAPARPASISLSAEPPRLGTQTASFQVFTKVIGQNGTGISGRQPRFFTNGARVSGGVSDLGNGDYKARFAANGEGNAEVAAVVLGDAGANPLTNILVIPARQQVRNDGATTTPVTILTVDRFGYPVPNITVSLKASQGGGMLPSTVTTDSAGITQFNYTAGRDPGIAELTATMGAISGGGALLQLPGTGANLTTLPISGTEAMRAQYRAWQQSIAYLQIEREGADSVVATDVTNRAGPLARIRVTPEPATVAAGGTITLRLRAEDEQGRGKAGQTFEFASTIGVIGTITDLGGGDYSAPLVVPPDTAEGEAKVTIASEDGEIINFTKIPVTAPAAVAGWGSSAEPEPEPEAEPEPEPKPERVRTPREPSDTPWLRVHAGYHGGNYGYNQTALTSTSPLYDQSVTFGGGTEAAAAGSVGMQFQARAFLPNVPYLGADVSVNTIRYGVSLPAFEEPVVDWVSDTSLQLIARYPYTFEGGQVHLGGRLGAGFSDFIVYKQEVEQGQRLLTYDQLLISALNMGGEIGLDISDLFVVGTLDIGLANGSIPYRTRYGLSLGYAFIDNVYAQAGFGYFSRQAEIFNDAETQVGSLQDEAFLFSLGIGYQL